MNIEIKGAYENNLKHMDVTIPKNKLVVFTGLSGSGKSTLAMDTLQRECQRQYMESMGLLINSGPKPKVKSIEGLSPAISISQQNTNRNPRSTVGTIADLTPYLRVLFSKLGERPCPHCGKSNSGSSEEQSDFPLTELPENEPDDNLFYEHTTTCFHCKANIPALSAAHFSFNKPQGACPTCKGIGTVNLPDIDLFIDKSKSIVDFAIKGWDKVYIDRYGTSLVNAAKHYGFMLDIEVPIEEYDEKQMLLLLYGVLGTKFSKHFPDINPPKTVLDGRFEGVVTNLMRRYEEKNSYSAKQKLEKFLIQQECPDCGGARFRSETLSVKLFGINITDALAMPLEELVVWLESLSSRLTSQMSEVVGEAISDLLRRINRILRVGAGYLSMGQAAGTLSAGEIQRIKLASVLGSGLTGVVYVLDEPTAGLHQRDRENIVGVLRGLRDLGNTVIVIEHDLALMRTADYLTDFGPGAGKYGGRVVASGTVKDLIACPESVTGKYLGGNVSETTGTRSVGNGKTIHISHAKTGNLKDVTVDIPLGRLVAVSGVSGAGKTCLIFGVLAEAAKTRFQQSNKSRDPHVTGLEHISEVICINESSIGRSGRSNIATYTDLFTDIRNLFAILAKENKTGLEARHFSYNVTGGRCEKCQGTGKISVPMHFLPDVEVVCHVCGGKRYRQPVLNVKYKEHSISDILDLSIDEAAVLLAQEKNISEKLKVIREVGLGYIGLGQPTSTLSGGEAQRLKLAKELGIRSEHNALYLFDEPTTGLHPEDTNRLIGVFRRLVEKGNSVVVIEHNTHVITASDWVIDLGPGGGKNGGTVVAVGTPDDLMLHPTSATGKVLARINKKE